MSSSEREVRKELVKEAIREWLEAEFSRFSRWTVRAILAALFSWVVYFFFTAHGWKLPP